MTGEEKETYFHINCGEDTVICESTIPRDFNKCVKQGWTILGRMLYEDGTVAGMKLQAPRKALSIRNVNVKKRELTNNQKKYLFSRKDSNLEID